MISNVAEVFSKDRDMKYANAADGSVCVSNGYFLLKISQKEFGALLAQLDRRRRKSPIELVENDKVLKIANEAEGKFEVSKPYEWEQSKDFTASVFADNKQHFAYNKKFVDVFADNGNRMFIDDNTADNAIKQSLVIKGGDGDFKGLILPINITADSRKKLHKVFPLENGKPTASKARAADKPPIAEQLAKAEKKIQHGEAPATDKKTKHNER